MGLHDAETDFSKVDAIEIATGPAAARPTRSRRPRSSSTSTRSGLGHQIAAVGSSDSHNAGRAAGFLTPQAPIGTATTVVFADELSEAGIQRGVQAGHTYVKLLGNDGPDLRFERASAAAAGAARSWATRVRGNQADFVARVLGGISGARGSRAAQPGGSQGRSARGRA